jgi:hypothetical protein
MNNLPSLKEKKIRVWIVNIHQSKLPIVANLVWKILPKIKNQRKIFLFYQLLYRENFLRKFKNLMKNDNLIQIKIHTEEKFMLNFHQEIY